MPVSVTTASVPTATAMASWRDDEEPAAVDDVRERPGGSPSAKKGRLSAVRSRDTMSGDGVSDAMSQPWPTSVM